MYNIVTIDECQGDRLVISSLIDAEPTYISVKHSEEAMEQVKLFMGDVHLTHFWGTWDNRRVLFWSNDLFTADMNPNKQGTIAYLQQCIPGTMHVIFGPVVGLLDPELW